MNLIVRWLPLVLILLSVQSSKCELDENNFECNKNDQFREFLQVQQLEYVELESEVVNVTSQTVTYVTEVHDIRINMYKIIHRYAGNNQWVLETTIANMLQKSIHKISNQGHNCENQDLNSSLVSSYAAKIVPSPIYGHMFEEFQKTLGPSTLLNLFFRLKSELMAYQPHQDNVATLQQDIHYNLCLDNGYLLKLTLIPSRPVFFKNVQIYQMNAENANSTWTLKQQINFFNQKLKPMLSTSVNSVFELPVGYGCQTVLQSPSASLSNFGKQGEFSFEMITTFKDPNPSTGDTGPHETIRNERILFDKDHKLTVYEQDIDNSKSRKVFAQETNTVYTVDESTGQCQSMSFEKAKNASNSDFLAFDNVALLFLEWPHIFDFESDFYILGNYTERDIRCTVAESFVAVPKANSLNAKFALITHFVPSNANYSPGNAGTHIPITIRIALFAHQDRRQEIAKISLNIFYFDTSVDHHDLLDISDCVQHSYDYNWAQFRFPIYPDHATTLRSLTKQLVHEVRHVLDVSPIRLPVMDLNFGHDAIYLTVKLLQDPAVMQYFDPKFEHGLSFPTQSQPSDNQHLCARQCFAKPDCAAFSFCSNLQCDLLLDPTLASTLNSSTGRYEYEMRSNPTFVANPQCNLYFRLIAANASNHLNTDNRLILSVWQSMVNNGSINVTLKDYKSAQLVADMFAINVGPGQFLDSTENLEQWNDDLEDEHNVEYYDHMFNVIERTYRFNVDLLTGNNIRHRKLTWLTLYECQLACVNEPQCASYSYCDHYLECILTELSSQDAVRDKLLFDDQCLISSKKYLVHFRLVTNHLPDPGQLTDNVLVDAHLDAEQCAKVCLQASDPETNSHCSSFSLCEGLDHNGQQTVGCQFNGIQPASGANQDNQTVQWNQQQTQCTFYAMSSLTSFREYFGQSLVEHDQYSWQQISLEKCASKCLETSACVSFDYCLTDPDNGQAEVTSCRLSSLPKVSSNVNPNQLLCSIYEKRSANATAAITSGPDESQDSGYTKLQISLLSILFLCVGLVIGALLSHFVLNKYFHL